MLPLGEFPLTNGATYIRTEGCKLYPGHDKDLDLSNVLPTNNGWPELGQKQQAQCTRPPSIREVESVYAS